MNEKTLTEYVTFFLNGKETALRPVAALNGLSATTIEGIGRVGDQISQRIGWRGRLTAMIRALRIKRPAAFSRRPIIMKLFKETLIKSEFPAVQGRTAKINGVRPLIL